MRFPLLAACLVLAACGADEQSPAAQPSPAAMELPDGRTATDEQRAFLEDVTPALSGDKAADVLHVLNEGESVCRIFADPSDPTQQRQAVDLLMDTGYGWTATEATVMVRSAAEHFCPS